MKSFVRLIKNDRSYASCVRAIKASMLKTPTHYSTETVRLEADFKTLFAASRQSYGSRRMAKGMRNQGYSMGRYQARTLHYTYL